MIVDHDQSLIEYVCVSPECKLSRFICVKCLRSGNHKHHGNDKSHILDNKELYSKLKEKLDKKLSAPVVNIKKLQTNTLK